MAELVQPVRIENGIAIYITDVAGDHPDYPAEDLHILHRVEETHFWFIARKERIRRVFDRYVPRTSSVLEIGAGTGNISRYLQERGYAVAAGEMHLNGLQYARQYGINKCYLFDLFDPPFANHFDVIGMFDVLEHLQEDVAALKQVGEILRMHGQLVLTVPAHQWLWSQDDAVAAHKRRYSLREIRTKLTEAGFTVVHARYFFSAITPLLLLRRFLHPDIGIAAGQAGRIVERVINPGINRFLLGLCRLENAISPWLPTWFGGSLIVVARKNPLLATHEQG